ncbi:MAG: CHAT domain-containing protein [Planctomycetaceae bacterium]
MRSEQFRSPLKTETMLRKLLQWTVFALLAGGQLLGEMPERVRGRLSQRYRSTGYLTDQDERIANREASEYISEGRPDIAMEIARPVLTAIGAQSVPRFARITFDKNVVTRFQRWTGFWLNYRSAAPKDDYQALRLGKNILLKAHYRQMAARRHFAASYPDLNRQYHEMRWHRKELSNRVSATATLPLPDFNLENHLHDISQLLGQIEVHSKAELTSPVVDGIPIVLHDPPNVVCLTRLHSASIEEILAAIPPDTALIEIADYPKYVVRPNGYEVTQHYVAFVLAKNLSGKTAIHRVDLGKSWELGQAIHKWVRSIESLRENAQAKSYINEYLWWPIDELLSVLEPSTLYIVPSGDTHRLPWVALEDPNGVAAVTRYKVAVLPFVEYLLQASEEEQTAIDRSDQSYRRGYTDYKDTPSPQFLHVSHGPSDEFLVEERGDNLRTPPELTRFYSEQFSNTSITTLLQSAMVCHFTMHATFSEDENQFFKQSSIIKRLSPLDSMLFTWFAIGTGAQHQRLTGYEISELDLSGMELVVLAACQTNAGETVSGEGNFSLAKAFHLAGCRDVVSSQWNVDDNATRVFMREFHTQLVRGLKPIDALHAVQLAAYSGRLRLEIGGSQLDALDLSSTRTATGRVNSVPYTWAPFILSGIGNRNPYSYSVSRMKEEQDNCD